MPRSPFMLGNRYGGVPPEVRAAGTERAYPFERGLATKMQNGATKAQIIAALQQQTLEARNRGLPIADLPALHGQMGDKDIEDYQRRLNQKMGIPETTSGPPNQTAAGQASTTGQPPTPNAAPRTVVPPADPSVKTFMPTNAPGITAPASKPVAPLVQPSATAKTDPMADAFTGTAAGATAVAKPKAPPAAVSTGSPTNPAPSGNQPPATPSASVPSNPMEQIMQRDGTLSPGQKLQHTGAGWSTVVQSAGGDRSVAVSPNGAQSLEYTFDGPARQQYGRGWNQLSPDERKQVIMGSDLFHRSEAPGGMVDNGKMYDPTLDTTKQRTVGADGSITVKGPYGTGSSTGAIAPAAPVTPPAAAPTAPAASAAAPVTPPAAPKTPDVNPNQMSMSRTSYLTGANTPNTPNTPKPVNPMADAFTGAGAAAASVAAHPIPPPGTDITSQSAPATKPFSGF